jgi:hypothetical protein
MKLWRNGGADLLILEFGTRLEMIGQLYARPALLPREYSRAKLDFGDENISSSCRDRKCDSSVFKHVA